MKKRRKLNKFKVLRFIFIVILIILLSLFTVNKFTKNNNSNLNLTKDTDIKDNDIYKVSMIMVGDNLIHDSIYQEASKNVGDNVYDFKPIYEEIKSIVKDYDIAYYNQETILGGSEIGVSSYPSFNSPYEVGDAMIDAGFNLVSLATNHTLDRGEQAILNSRKYWNNQTNVLAVGSYSSQEEKETIQIKEVNNIKYTMLNYTYGTNGISVPNGKDYLVNVWPVTGNNPNTDKSYQSYKEQIKKDIEAVREKVDVLIVAMHWGIEYENTPNAYQIDAAKYLESLGVDIIIGTHPHVVQPVDYINNTLVIYSLGNFLSAHEVVNIANRVGLMTSLEITKNSKTNKITIDNVQNELLYTYYTKDYTNFKVIPFSKMNTNYLSNYKEVYEEYKNIVKKQNKNINVVPLE
jgi:poly-gamma-glutamate synthesis protein (capsule biosynthesis protein)